MKKEETKETEEILEENSESEEENLEEIEPTEEKQNSEETEEWEEKFNQLNEQFLRLQADFSNFRRRSNEEKNSYLNLGVEKIAGPLLNVIDNFERGLAIEEDKDSGFYQGMDMVAKQLIELLEKNDIKEIEAKDQKFDPNLHHAVFVESLEGVEAGIVTEVLQKGYMHKDKVLRPSMVKVSE